MHDRHRAKREREGLDYRHIAEGEKRLVEQRRPIEQMAEKLAHNFEEALERYTSIGSSPWMRSRVRKGLNRNVTGMAVMLEMRILPAEIADERIDWFMNVLPRR